MSKIQVVKVNNFLNYNELICVLLNLYFDLMKMFLLISLIFLGGIGLYFYLSDTYEQPEYQVLKKFGNIEYRYYEPMLVAKHSKKISADWDDINQSFKILADYIFGNNKSNENIGMTIPVMTQQAEGEMFMMFYIPRCYEQTNVPIPRDENIKLQKISSRPLMVIQFKGRYTEENFKIYLKQLKDFCEVKGLQINNNLAPIYAAYNNPWITPPFMRKNEIWLAVDENKM